MRRARATPAIAAALLAAMCGAALLWLPGCATTSRPAAKRTPPVESLLTVADIERATELKVKTVPADPYTGAAGDLNFATADGQLALMFQRRPGSQYEKLKAAPGAWRADVPELGDDAFEGPAAQSTGVFTLTVREGETTIMLAGLRAADGTSAITPDHLRRLALVVVGRL